MPDDWDARSVRCQGLFTLACSALPQEVREKAAVALHETDGPRGPYYDATDVVIGALVEAGVRMGVPDA